MISCQQYDYIEIACMYHYPLRVVLKNGDSIEGKALDTKRNDTKQECIELQTEQGKSLAVLDEIKTLEVLIKNPHFPPLLHFT